jgi:hypothetical protein
MENGNDMSSRRKQIEDRYEGRSMWIMRSSKVGYVVGAFLAAMGTLDLASKFSLTDMVRGTNPYENAPIVLEYERVSQELEDIGRSLDLVQGRAEVPPYQTDDTKRLVNDLFGVPKIGKIQSLEERYSTERGEKGKRLREIKEDSDFKNSAQWVFNGKMYWFLSLAGGLGLTTLSTLGGSSLVNRNRRNMDREIGDLEKQADN